MNKPKSAARRAAITLRDYRRVLSTMRIIHNEKLEADLLREAREAERMRRAIKWTLKELYGIKFRDEAGKTVWAADELRTRAFGKPRSAK